MQSGNEWAPGRMRAHLLESAETLRRVVEGCGDSILAAAAMMAETFRHHGKLLLCGNGGSAADCQHVATELVSRLSADFERPALPAIALTTDTSLLTAYTNDFGAEGMFARQIQALGRPGDLLMAISTSGTSRNVVHGAEAAHQVGMRVVALTGAGGRLAELADVMVAVPSANTQYIQEAHLVIEHVLCDLVERELFPGTQASS